MCITKLKAVLFAAIVAFILPASSYAADDAKLKAFNEGCIKSFMKDAAPDQDKTKVNQFAERFCTCAGNKMAPVLDKPNASKDEVDKVQEEATKFCLSNAVLQQSVNSFSGTENISEDKIEAACISSWGIAMPGKMNDKQMQEITAYCHCASGPLIGLTNKEENLSDEKYNDALGDVANLCIKQLVDM